MLDIGWTELLVIGALALIVVGPRDLPQLLRQVGRWVGQIKRMAGEFQRSIEDAARDTDLNSMKELRDLRKDLGGLDFRQQAAKAQSYLKQSVKVEPTAGAKPGQPTGTPAPEPGAPAPGASAASVPVAPAAPAAEPAASPAPAESPSTGAKVAGAAKVVGAKGSGTKVSGAKGSGAKVSGE